MKQARAWSAAALAVMSIGASSALAAGGAADPDPQGLSAAGQPPRPEPPAARPVDERRTRTFAGQDAAAATRTAAGEFPEFVDEKAWVDLAERPDVEVTRYLAPQSALIEAGGQAAVVQSQLPISVKTPDGLRAVDADLVDVGSVMEPRRPLTEYSIAERADENLLRFESSGLAVGPSAPTEPTGRESGESRVHPNVARDTDLIVKPTPIGAQFGWVLRSIDSPNLLRLKVTMRDGDRLLATSADGEGPRKGPDGGAVVLQDGKPALSISPTVAVDADGMQVPISINSDADELFIRVDTSKSRMPVLVDPYVAEDQRNWSTNAGLDFNGWRFAQAGGTFGSLQGNLGFGRGQYLFSDPSQTYSNVATGPAYGQWVFDAPYVPGFESEGAHIFKADFGQTVHTVSDRGSCIATGIFSRTLFRYEPQGIYRGPSINDLYAPYQPPNGYVNCVAEGVPGQGQTYGYKVHCLSRCGLEGGDPNNGSPGNAAVISLLQGAGKPTRGGVVYQGSSLIFMSEQAPPRMSGNAAPADWTNQSFRLTNTAIDYGLGMYRQFPSVGAAANGNCDGAQPSEGGPQGSANTGDRNRRCQRSLTSGINSADLPEGVSTARFRAVDVVDNETTRSVPVKIDRTPPVLEVAGDLRNLGSAADAARGRDLYGLRIAAVDGNTSSDASRRVGVKEVLVKVDGVVVERYESEPTCTDSCSVIVDDFFLNTDFYDEGPHTVSVEAVDRLNQDSTPVTWTIGIPRENFYAASVAAWKADVERRVDEALPVVPLIGPMPAVPAGWRDETGCRSSTASLSACYQQVETWAMDVRNWLTQNLASLSASTLTLPDPPTFDYAKSEETAVDLTRRTRDAFVLARSMVANPLGSVQVAINFNDPVTPTDVLTAMPATAATSSQTVVAGIFEPDAATIGGTMSNPRAALLSQTLEDFYVQQIAIAQEDVTQAEADVPEDAEEADEIAAFLADHRRFIASLQARQPFVKGVAMQMSVPTLLQALLRTDTANLIKSVKLLPDAQPLTTLGVDSLTSVTTNSGTVATERRRAAAPAAASASAPQATAAGGAQTCYDRNEKGRVAQGTLDPSPVYFSPSRFEYDTLLGESDGAFGILHMKEHRWRWRWQAARGLAWMCAGSPGDRNVEFESMVYPDDDERWSDNWESNSARKYTQHNAPEGGNIHQDDIASGDDPFQLPPGNPFDKSKYPDFAILFQSSAEFEYRKLYKLRYVTNEGETDSGRVINSVQATHRASNGAQQGYCDARFEDYKSCMFSTTTFCLQHRQISDPPSRRVLDWRAILGTELTKISSIAKRRPELVNGRNVRTICNPRPPGSGD